MPKLNSKQPILSRKSVTKESAEKTKDDVESSESEEEKSEESSEESSSEEESSEEEKEEIKKPIAKKKYIKPKQMIAYTDVQKVVASNPALPVELVPKRRPATQKKIDQLNKARDIKKAKSIEAKKEQDEIIKLQSALVEKKLQEQLTKKIYRSVTEKIRKERLDQLRKATELDEDEPEKKPTKTIDQKANAYMQLLGF